MTTLTKTVRDEDYGHVLTAHDAAGSNIVDHGFHIGSEPQNVQTDVAEYHNDVIAHPRPIAVQGNSRLARGASPKVFYRARSGKYFLVKPYHEKIRSGAWDYMHYPYAGFAEMASQALYHAGGIGHLHSKLHVAPHTLKGKVKPMLVVSIDPNAKTVDMLPQTYKSYPHKMYNEAAKIGLMDFLTNNNDRHHFNLMYYPDQEGQPQGLLAIDSGRAFQYKRANRWATDPGTPRDNVFHYLSSSQGMHMLNRAEHDQYVGTRPHISHALEWWKANGPAIRKEMVNQLQAVTDENVRQWIWSNFLNRSQVLDKLSKAWDDHPDERLYLPEYELPEEYYPQDLNVNDRQRLASIPYTLIYRHRPVEPWDSQDAIMPDPKEIEEQAQPALAKSLGIEDWPEVKLQEGEDEADR